MNHDLLLKNWGIKLISVILAVVLWLIARGGVR